MSFFTAANVVVGNGGGTSPASGSVQQWASNLTFSDGQAVVFNGSMYVAIGSPPMGLIPPVEVATPQQPGSPKWMLAARGRTPAAPWDDTTTYYQDQVVRYMGGTYVLDKATVAAGTRPSADPAWTPLSEVLTDVEAQKVTTGNLGNFGFGITAAIFQNADEIARVRSHRVRVASLNITPPGVLYEMFFPKPIGSLTPPMFSINAEDQDGWILGLAAQPIYNANQCVGYRCFTTLGFANPGTYEFSVTVKQPLA